VSYAVTLSQTFTWQAIEKRHMKERGSRMFFLWQPSWCKQLFFFFFLLLEWTRQSREVSEQSTQRYPRTHLDAAKNDAQSSRAVCKKCDKTIAQDTVRLGGYSTSRFFDGVVPMWHHVDCMLKTSYAKRLTSVVRCPYRHLLTRLQRNKSSTLPHCDGTIKCILRSRTSFSCKERIRTKVTQLLAQQAESGETAFGRQGAYHYSYRMLIVFRRRITRRIRKVKSQYMPWWVLLSKGR
jgi:hypothetical protein